MNNILVIHGPNLNMTGIREPGIYGSLTLLDINNMIKERADKYGVSVEFFQSNCEGEIIDKIHSAYNNKDGIIINPGAYSHYSLAIADALRAVSIKTAEVHISNVFKREAIRTEMVTANAADVVISGAGAYSYVLGLEALLNAWYFKVS